MKSCCNVNDMITVCSTDSVFVVHCSQSFQYLHRTVEKHSEHSTLDIVCVTHAHIYWLSFLLDVILLQLNKSLSLAFRYDFGVTR